MLKPEKRDDLIEIITVDLILIRYTRCVHGRMCVRLCIVAFKGAFVTRITFVFHKFK